MAARASGREKPGHAPWDYGNVQNPEGSQGGGATMVGESPCVRFKVSCVGVGGFVWCFSRRAVTWYPKGRFRLAGRKQRGGEEEEEGRGGSARPVVSASGQLPLSNPSGHLEDGMMRQRSED